MKFKIKFNFNPSKYNKGIIYGVAIFLVLVVGFLILNEINGKSISHKIISPILNKTSGISRGVSGFIDRKYIHDEQENKIRDLETENSKLRKQLIENLISQEELRDLKELKTMLKLKDENIYDEYITADIISKDGNGFYSSFLISAGKKDGITEGSLVLSGTGLAGVVDVSYDNYSKVVSILDSKMSMSFSIARNEKITGIASQNIDSKAFEDIKEGLLKGYCNETEEEVLLGDIVITSGMGVYPKGIEIGEVYEIIEDSTNLLKYIKIKPYTDFNDLDKVMVIKTRKMD
ncbi:MAG: rod shape-determining protein MreC [Proteocatella sp.]